MPEHVWRCRWYQRPLHEYLMTQANGRAIEIAHRRWGKDEVALNVTRDWALKRPGNYWHCLPEYAQARKAIWEAVNAHTGKRRLDEAFPHAIRRRTDTQTMFIEFVNGSTWQAIGSDSYDSTVGSGPVGIVYSEWALANPSAWGYHRPMLEENGGWAAFITTPRGNNHAKAMYDMAANNPRWFAEVSNAQTTGALSPEQLEEALTEYQAIYGADFGLAYFEQEYLCSFAGAMVGAIFGGEVSRAEREGRIREVPIDIRYPVHTAWDLGKAVNNPIWCFQVLPGEAAPRVVDFYRPESDDLEEWVSWLNERGYRGNDYLPHDAAHTEWGTKRTRVETLKLLGRKPKRIAKVSVAEGINAGNRTLRVCVMDKDRCQQGIEGLKNYRREWDDELKTFRENPVKDWSEHIGSAWRYLGLCWQEEIVKVEKPKKPDELEFVANQDGALTINMSVKEWVEARVRKRKAEGHEYR